MSDKTDHQHPQDSETCDHGDTVVPEPDPLDDAASLNELFGLVRRTTGGDFRHYKSSTVRRRIFRRMRMSRVGNLREYVDLLGRDPQEITSLRKDLLISVTQFFRDPEVFDYLGEHVFPAMVRESGPGGRLRVWVPGCSTGEEVYSLLIALLETARSTGVHPAIAITGTDVSEECLVRAERGLYPFAIEADIPSALLARYFERTDSGYQARESLGRCASFAQQDIVTDTPLAEVDLVSFRNVLIYMDHELQSQVLLALHASLVPNGILVLGTSETVGSNSPLFTPLDKRRKVFRRRSVHVRPSQDPTVLA